MVILWKTMAEAPAAVQSCAIAVDLLSIEALMRFALRTVSLDRKGN